MTDPNIASCPELIHSLFDAQRTSHQLRARIATLPAEDVLKVAAEEITSAKLQPIEDERTLRLVNLATVLSEFPGARTVDLLIDVLAAEEPEARHAAGSVLEEMAYDRFKDVALGIERAMTRLPPQSHALTELPYLLIEIPEPGALKLLHKFLELPEAEVVAAAIEACVEAGDSSSVRPLERLFRDKRMVSVEDEEEEAADVSAEMSIGELAQEACELLSEDEDNEG